MQSSFLDALRERVLVFDGAMGTSILSLIEEGVLTPQDYQGHPDCNEILVVSRPDIIERIHCSYLDAGCDAIETDSFNGAPHVLAEHGLADRSYEMNVAAANVARRAADRYATSEKPRFVIGSLGPGSKSIVLGTIDFDTMFASYTLQAKGLVDGGVDVLLVETCFDLLQCKCAILACAQAAADAGRRVPIMAQITVEANKRMLLGTEPAAALTALEAMPIDLIGINCGTGPETMAEHVRTLVQGTALPVSVLPNAGLPETRNGKSVFPLQPETLADWHEKFVTEYGVNVVGGCCGTSPAHMKAVVDRIALRSPLQRHVAHVPALSSLYSQQPYSRDCGCLIVAGKTNANQNDQFRSQLLEGEIDGLVAIARKQAREGAHVVDLCVDCPGRDPVEDIRLVASRFAESLKAAVMVDSGTKSELVFEEALKRLPGKSIVSSVSFEDGGKTVAKVLPICRKYGAAVVCRTIDENGSAHDIDGVLRVARRLYRVAVDDYQIAPENLFFDTLTLDAIRAIKAEMPCANTIMNVADLSSAVDTDARAVFESVLAHHAQLAGATAVIVTNAKLVPISSLPQDKVQAAEALIFDRES